jgi:hypothetical protein
LESSCSPSRKGCLPWDGPLLPSQMRHLRTVLRDQKGQASSFFCLASRQVLYNSSLPPSFNFLGLLSSGSSHCSYRTTSRPLVSIISIPQQWKHANWAGRHSS